MKNSQSLLVAAALLGSAGYCGAQEPPLVSEAQFLGDGSFLVVVRGEPGASYRILASDDLAIWDTIANQVTDPSFGDLAFVDRAAPFFRARFYGVGLAGGDATFPNLTLTSPTNELSSQSTVLLEGTAFDASGIREVRVNNLLLPGTTTFSTLLPLIPGTNRFLVSATDLSVNRNRRSLIIQLRYIPLLPAILVQPASQTNLVTATATFNVTATGTAPLYYQWRKNGVELLDSARHAGVTTTSLTISNVGAADATSYTVVITNTSGAVTSEVATLTIKTPPGFVPITDADYFEDFNSLGDTGTNTPPGWYVGAGTGAVSATNVTVSTGSSTGGNNYNLGSAGSPDRALGSLASAALPRNTEARFLNASGSNILSFAIHYTGEQWRQGGASAVNNDLVLQFSTTGTNFSAMGSEFNFNTPYDTGPAGALDGNATTNRVTDIGGNFFPVAAITNGGIFYLRWVDTDNTSSDHAIAIDDLNVTFTFENAP